VVRWVEPKGSPPLPSCVTQNKTYYNILTNQTKDKQVEIINIQANSTTYWLLFGEYYHPNLESKRCVFVWLKNGIAGPSLSWDKGSHVYANYVLEKVDINCADLTGILSGLKSHYPETIGEMMGFDERYMYERRI
tara:strand:- start:121 stop:525 length:405 start_codon:yes stop_codon:yes gene_type:complete